MILEPGKKAGRPALRPCWRDVTDENKRLNFVTFSRVIEPSLAEGLAFIREGYAEMIPDDVSDLI